MSVEKIMRASGDVVWRVRWRQHGRNRARTFSTRRDARDFDAEVRRQRQAGSLPALDAGAETFGEYVTETWAASHAATLAPKTRLHYASLYDYHLRPYLGLIARVRLRRRSSGVGRQTAWHRGRVPLRFGMRWICSGRFWNTHSWAGRSRRILPGASRRRGRLGGRRCNRFRPERSRRCAKRSTHATRRSSLSSRMRVFVLERRWALRWGDVREQTLLIQRATSLGEESDTKTRHHRTVRLLGPLSADLRSWRMAAGHPGDSELVFAGKEGQPWTQAAYQSWRRRAFKRGTEAAGLAHARPYDLRHSFASLLLHEGRSVICVARQLGHDARLTLTRYGHVIDELEDTPRIEAEAAIANARLVV